VTTKPNYYSHAWKSRQWQDRIAGKMIFLEEDGLLFKANLRQFETFFCKFDHSKKIKLIDSPGFGYNKPEVTNEEILNKILNFLTEDGLFFLQSKSRF